MLVPVCDSVGITIPGKAQTMAETGGKFNPKIWGHAKVKAASTRNRTNNLPFKPCQGGKQAETFLDHGNTQVEGF